MPPVLVGATLSLLLVTAPEPWIRSNTPQRDTWELGAHGGAFVLSERHDLYDLHTAPQKPLRRVGPLGGLRAAYFPLSFVGAEAEFDGIWTELANGREPVFVWGFRGHAVLQLPLFRVVPLVFGGYGLLGARSSRDAVGNDVDPIGHYGVGLKLRVAPWLAVRVDGRHMLSAAFARRRAVAHHGAVTLGLSFTLGNARRSLTASEPATQIGHPDADQDGVADAWDACPDQPGPGRDGCAFPDTDQDGLVDLFDRCPSEAGGQADGCPAADSDGDGLVDAHDRCPDEAGEGPDGCVVAAPAAPEEPSSPAVAPASEGPAEPPEPVVPQRPG